MVELSWVDFGFVTETWHCTFFVEFDSKCGDRYIGDFERQRVLLSFDREAI